MLFGRVVRPAAIGATLRSVDDAKARAMAGVTVVRDGDFVGVVAPQRARGERAPRPRWSVEWDRAAGPADRRRRSTTTSKQDDAHRRRAGAGASPGDVARARARRRARLEASYRIPYIAHVPLEPRAAVAEWSGRQGHGVDAARSGRSACASEVAQAFRLPEDRVRVIVPDMGSGYGGKHTGEHAIEAARLAKAAGRPVKLVYTRAEEFMWGYFRPAA